MSEAVLLVGDDTGPLVLLIRLADGKSTMSTSDPNQGKEQPSGERELF